VVHFAAAIYTRGRAAAVPPAGSAATYGYDSLMNFRPAHEN
jgi:hypothetical protein